MDGGGGGKMTKVGFDLPMKSLVDSSVNEMSTVEDSLVMRNLSPAEEDSMTEDYGFSDQEESEGDDMLGEGSQNKKICVSSPQEKKPAQRSLLEKYGNTKSKGLDEIAKKDVRKNTDSCVPQLGSTESMAAWNNILSCFAENPKVVSDRTTSDETIAEDETRDQMDDNNKNKTDKHLNSTISHLSFTIGGDDSNNNEPIIAKTEMIHESEREIELTNLGKKKDYYISTN